MESCRPYFLSCDTLICRAFAFLQCTHIKSLLVTRLPVRLLAPTPWSLLYCPPMSVNVRTMIVRALLCTQHCALLVFTPCRSRQPMGASGSQLSTILLASRVWTQSLQCMRLALLLSPFLGGKSDSEWPWVFLRLLSKEGGCVTTRQVLRTIPTEEVNRLPGSGEKEASWTTPTQKLPPTYLFSFH